ncbi:Gfo/Idh/MocA family protein [Rhodocaloribacter sp.]
MSRTNIVSVGYGYWGKNIARNLNELGVLYGICEVDSAAQERARNAYPGVKSYSSYQDVLEDAEVDAVALSTPAETHARLAIRALEVGKDVFVEKPLALTYSDGSEMIDCSEKHGRILMVGHLLEYHPAVLALCEVVHSGELGKIQYVYSNRLNLGKFRREENILWSFAPHDISVILRLIGELPIEVIATGGGYLQPNIADVTTTNLLFDNGVRGHIFVSWLHPYKEQKLVVVGSKKMAVFNDCASFGEKLVIHDKGADWVDNRPLPRNGERSMVDYPDLEPLKSELRHFVDCIRTRSKPDTDGYNGLRVLQVLRAAQQSLQTGGTRVLLRETALIS